VIRTAGNDTDSLYLTTEQWQDLGELFFKIPSCPSDLHQGMADQYCYEVFTNFLDFTAPARVIEH
jgi:hypothetical protein